MSAQYGQGELACEGLRGRCLERGLENIVLTVGGNLVIGKKDFAETERRFKEMGFDRVYGPDANLEKAAAELRQDIVSRA